MSAEFVFYLDSADDLATGYADLDARGFAYSPGAVAVDGITVVSIQVRANNAASIRNRAPAGWRLRWDGAAGTDPARPHLERAKEAARAAVTP